MTTISSAESEMAALKEGPREGGGGSDTSRDTTGSGNTTTSDGSGGGLRGGGGGGGGGSKRGTACRWNDRGFGFITPDDGGDDLFCHCSAITDGDCLKEGARVEYSVVFDAPIGHRGYGQGRAIAVTGGSSGGGATGGSDGSVAAGPGGGVGIDPTATEEMKSDLDAHADLGIYMVEKCGGDEKMREEGLARIKVAIDNDHIGATIKLGRWSRKGDFGVEKNLTVAARCFHAATKLGSVEGRYLVSPMPPLQCRRCSICTRTAA